MARANDVPMERRTLRERCAVFALGLLGALGASGAATAQVVDCSALPTPIYLQVGDTQEPLMKKLGRALRDADAPISIVYVTSGSCTNVEALYTGVPITKNPLYVPSIAEDPTWTSDKPAKECKILPGGHPVDIANSALFVSSCNPSPPPAGIKLFQGPVQGYGFVVPKQSTQRAITAEEAYFAFGFGERGMAAPWTNRQRPPPKLQRVRRPPCTPRYATSATPSKSTIAMVAAFRMPATKCVVPSPTSAPNAATPIAPAA